MNTSSGFAFPIRSVVTWNGRGATDRESPCPIRSVGPKIRNVSSRTPEREGPLAVEDRIAAPRARRNEEGPDSLRGADT